MTISVIKTKDLRPKTHLNDPDYLQIKPIGPDGKIISLGQTRKKQPGLRGQELLKSLDELLPPQNAVCRTNLVAIEAGVDPDRMADLHGRARDRLANRGPIAFGVLRQRSI
jgi:hypothetical protein